MSRPLLGLILLNEKVSLSFCTVLTSFCFGSFCILVFVSLVLLHDSFVEAERFFSKVIHVPFHFALARL